MLFMALAAWPSDALSAVSSARLGSEEHRQAMVAQIEAALERNVAAEARSRRGVKAPDVGGNTCASGKLLPEFYLLGVKNSATTSLFVDLGYRGVVAAPGKDWWYKEWQFFQQYSNMPLAEQQALWLSSLPDCPRNRTVMGDLSTTNIFVVQLPSDLAWSQTLGYPARSDLDYTTWDTPRLIRKFHHEAGGTMPKFLLMLREPLARTQSEYYHTLPLKNCNGCIVNGSFVDSFATNVALLQLKPPQISDWFWKGFYSRQIEEYLKYFSAERFLFVPNREYFAIDPRGFSSTVLSWLGIEAEPWSQAYHANSHSKPALDKELPPGTASREAYQAFMAPESERLVRTLALAHAQGAQLAGYAGPPGDVAAVRAWLERGW